MVLAHFCVHFFARPVSIAFVEDFQQPFANPVSVQEPLCVAGIAGKTESHPRVDVFLVRRQVGRAVLLGHHSAVEGQGQAMAVTVDIRVRQLDQAHARPVAGAFVETVWWHETKERDRQPETVEQLKAALHIDAENRLGLFDLLRLWLVEVEILFFVVEQTDRQRVGERNKFTWWLLAQVERKSKVHELDAGVANQRDGFFELCNFRQHRDLSSLIRRHGAWTSGSVRFHSCRYSRQCSVRLGRR